MQHPDDCFSNDPENKKGPKLKTWQEPIGSMRHLRGTECRSVMVTIAMDWAAASTEHKTTITQTVEGKNTTFDYCPSPWQKVAEVEGMASHSLVLEAPVPGLTGATVALEGVPKQGFTFLTLGNKLDTGTDFRQELSATFTFMDETSSRRERKKTEVVTLPPFLAPKTEVKVGDCGPSLAAGGAGGAPGHHPDTIHRHPHLRQLHLVTHVQLQRPNDDLFSGR